MAVKVKLRAIVLPANHVLMPGIVMRMATPAAAASRASSYPVAAAAYDELRRLIPFLGTDDTLLAIVPRDAAGENPHNVAALARIISPGHSSLTTAADPASGHSMALTVQGLARISVESLRDGVLEGDVVVDDADAAGKYTADLVDKLKASVSALLLPNGQQATAAVRRFVSFAEGVSSTSTLIDILVSVLPLTHQTKLDLLDDFDGYSRGVRLVALVEQRAKEFAEIAAREVEEAQREESQKQQQQQPSPKQQAVANALIRRRQGQGRQSGKDDDDDGIDKIEKTLRAANLPDDGRKTVDRELRRIRRMTPQQAEYNVTRTYLETLADMPWNNNGVPILSPDVVEDARKILDADHYGLEKVKKRLLEYLAVLYLQQQQEEHRRVAEQSRDISHEVIEYSEVEPATPPPTPSNAVVPVGNNAGIEAAKPKSTRAPILLLVGPPGVGKTSLAKSVARAINRKLHRISLGGVRDEAEIRGHRRTYIGAMPGVLVQGLRKAGAMNPVFVLDEIDKVGQGVHGVHGDPAAALLEVLDPEQNSTFVDHYVGFPVDLSNVVFIATANTTETIPGPLLDRMEVVSIEGYTYIEKQHIAQNYLIPKQIVANALRPGEIVLPDNVVTHIATHYTRESGVRSLEREIGTLCRGRAVEILEERRAGASDHTAAKPVTIELEDLPRYLGVEKFHDDVINDEVDEYTGADGHVRHRDPYGLVNGLAYMGSGSGGILSFEATKIPNGSGKLKLTGKLGDVISESAQIAMSWVRVHAEQLGLPKDVLSNVDIHLHAPAGAIPKDGPSAGVAMTLCLVSLLAKRPIPRDLAMTGEITLRGKILPVGGIREKLLGAHHAGVRKVLLPFHTKSVVEDQAKLVQQLGIEIVYVKYIWDVFAQVWPRVAQFKEPQIDARL